MPRSGRILVVDDEVNARTALAELLRDEGFEVETAADAFKALGKHEAFAPHVVVTDLKMPGMDGIELVKKLRAMEDPPAVVVMTAFGAVETAVDAMRAGAADYLTKPLNFDELLVVLDKRARAPSSCGARRASCARACATASRPSNIVGVAPADAARVRDHRSGRAEQGDRADHRRERHRQGAGRARDPPALAARERAVRQAALRGARRDRCSRASCSATRRARSPARWRARTAGSSSPTAARCSSTRSARSRRRSRSSCCASCRSTSSSASAARRRSRSTSASSRRPTATCARRSRRAASARTSTTGSTSSRSRCRRCATAAADIPALARFFLDRYAKANGKPIDGFAPRRARAAGRLRLAGQRARARERDRARGRARDRHARSRRGTCRRRSAGRGHGAAGVPGDSRRDDGRARALRDPRDARRRRAARRRRPPRCSASARARSSTACTSTTRRRAPTSTSCARTDRDVKS